MFEVILYWVLIGRRCCGKNAYSSLLEANRKKRDTHSFTHTKKLWTKFQNDWLVLWGMPLLFLISELVHSKYFDSAANSFLLRLFSLYQLIRKQVMDTSKMVAAKDDITFKKLYVYNGLFDLYTYFSTFFITIHLIYDGYSHQLINLFLCNFYA